MCNLNSSSSGDESYCCSCQGPKDNNHVEDAVMQEMERHRNSRMNSENTGEMRPVDVQPIGNGMEVPAAGVRAE